MRIKWIKSGFRALAVVLAAAGCGGNQSAPGGLLYQRLRDHIDWIKVVDTHEHQRLRPEFREKKINFYTVLASSYLVADLVSSGSPQLDNKEINGGDLGKLWAKHGAYLDNCRNTSYYGQFRRGFALLYGFDDPYFTRANIKGLSGRISDNYRNLDRWYGEAFQRAGFEIMLNDQYWDQFNVDIDKRYYALVMRVDTWIASISDRSRLLKGGGEDEVNNPFARAEKEGFAIRGLDDYVGYFDRWLGIFLDHGVVCAKSAQAYRRTLYFEEVPEAEAQGLFATPSDHLSAAQKKRLEDFMFHHIVKKCGEAGLPIQIHTGYLAGNGGTLDNGMPVKLNNLFLKYPETTFDLFHGGYPWYTEIGALAKMFPNVYIDLVWLPQISREAAVAALQQWLDCAPGNKIVWGGDCHMIEEAAGSLQYGKDVVAQVLAERVEAGLATEEFARDLANKIFRENAVRLFKLEEKLGKSFL